MHYKKRNEFGAVLLIISFLLFFIVCLLAFNDNVEKYEVNTQPTYTNK